MGKLSVTGKIKIVILLFYGTLAAGKFFLYSIIYMTIFLKVYKDFT